MKKYLSLLLALVFVMSLCACGGEKTETPAKDLDSDMGITLEEHDSGNSNTSATAATPLTYDDLPRTKAFWIWPEEGDEFGFRIDYPNTRFDTHGNGMGSEDSLDYSIVVAHSQNTMAGMTLEDAFMEFLNGSGGFHSVLKTVNRATYSEMTPDTETVTLPCGRKAIKFSGIQSYDDYGTLADCPIYGYCVMYETVPVIVCHILFKADAVDSTTLSTLTSQVDEMVNTIRPAE